MAKKRVTYIKNIFLEKYICSAMGYYKLMRKSDLFSGLRSKLWDTRPPNTSILTPYAQKRRCLYEKII